MSTDDQLFFHNMLCIDHSTLVDLIYSFLLSCQTTGIFYLCVKCLIVILILLMSPCSDCSLIVSLLTNQISEIIWFLSPGWRTLSMTPAMVSATTETLATVQWVVALVSGVQTESRTKMTVQEINMTWVTPFKMGIVIYPRRCPV